MADDDEQIDRPATEDISRPATEDIGRPATWENVVMGKAKEALGHLVRDPQLVEQGEEQEQDAREIHEEYTEQRDED